ncbi:MAG: SGNH/GDSL hydrolase family protein [Candidatus Azobacteroides sp.]|nr:SGNH/GDSL hydrolase family protein [Candidatus Azobacteroides sp.]
MKKTILLMSFLSFMGLLKAQTDITDAANFKRYVEANKNNTITNGVVFIGNSITEGWVNMRPEFFSSNNYIGRGISGQTSPQLLLRFRQDVLNLKPEAVVINIGTNDIALNTGEYCPQLTIDCIRSMADLAQAHGIKVILSSVLPVGEYPWRKEVKDVPKKIDELNARIKAYADANGFGYIDYNTPMREPNGALIAAYGNDGVHPTAEGYEIMEKIAKATIDKVLKK